jgi:5-methylcytosine-specific restriction endonuclease McrBC regulatory subunit McrC
MRSKIPNLALLQWLAYLDEFPRLTTWLQDAGVGTGDWHHAIARLYLSAIEQVTRRHVQKDYVCLAAEEPAIRGRIVMRNLLKRLHRLPRIPQIQRRRTLDTPCNIVLALALDRLPMLLADAPSGELRRLGRLREQWALIRREIDDPLACVAACQWASPPGYRDALQLAKLILTGAALDPGSNFGGQAFTLSLAGIWERALRRMFEEVSRMLGWHPVPGDQRTRRWDDPVGRDDPNRWLTTDVIVERAGTRWVLDAKYKREFGDESRIDRFQMCAYALAFDADRVSLVYPTAAKTAAGRKLLTTAIRGKRLCVDSFELPMVAGPEPCLAALADITSGQIDTAEGVMHRQI